jgi:Rieske Fe-S protein
VPVGSGVIVDEVVVTQPTAGVFKGFSATCTHAGCTVREVAGGTINCPCHGSKFNLDGTVANGPAARPLEAKTVSVQGDSIVLG